MVLSPTLLAPSGSATPMTMPSSLSPVGRPQKLWSAGTMSAIHAPELALNAAVRVRCLSLASMP